MKTSSENAANKICAEILLNNMQILPKLNNISESEIIEAVKNIRIPRPKEKEREASKYKKLYLGDSQCEYHNDFVCQRDFSTFEHKKQFVAFDNFMHYCLTLLNRVERHYYETVRDGMPTKVHFDLDIGNNLPLEYFSEEFINTLKDKILEIVFVIIPEMNLEEDVIINTAHQQGKKYSMHIIINTYTVNWEEFLNIYRYVADNLYEWDENIIKLGMFDQSLCRQSKNAIKQFRSVFNCKLGTTRYLRFEPVWTYKGSVVEYKYPGVDISNSNIDQLIKDVLIHVLYACSITQSSKPIEGLPTRIANLIKPSADVNNMPLYQNNTHIDDVAEEDITEAISMFDDASSFVFQKADGNIISLNRIKPSNCGICLRVHDSIGTYLTIVKGVVRHKCYRDKNRKIILGKLSSYVEEEQIYEEVPVNTDNQPGVIEEVVVNTNNPHAVTVNTNNPPAVTVNTNNPPAAPVVKPSIDLKKHNPDLTDQNIATIVQKMVEYIMANFPPNEGYVIEQYLLGYIVSNTKERCKMCFCTHVKQVKIYYHNGSVKAKCIKTNKTEKILELVKPSWDYHTKKQEGLKHTLKDEKKFTPPDRSTVSKYISKYVKPFDPYARIQIVQSNTETGKTLAAINMLLQAISESEPGKLPLILILTPRKSLASNIVKTYEKYGISIKSYKSMKGGIDVSSCVQLESVSRISRLNWDHVIFDECTSLIAQLNSGLHINLEKSYTVLGDIIQNSDHLLFLDAQVDRRTVKLIEYFLPDVQDIQVHINEYCKVGRQAICYNEIGFPEMFKRMRSLIKDGKNIVFITTSETMGDKQKRILDDLGYTPRFYSGKNHKLGTDEEISDPNNWWVKHQIVIYTSTIGSGVDVSALHFDYKFLYATSSTVCVRDIMQMIGRVRTTSTEELHYFLKNVSSSLPTSRKDIINKINNGLNCTDLLYDTIKGDLPESSKNSKKENMIKSFIPPSLISRELKYSARTNLKYYEEGLMTNIWNDITVDNIAEINRSKRHFYEEFDLMLETEQYTVVRASAVDRKEKILSNAEISKMRTDEIREYFEKATEEDYIVSNRRNINGEGTAFDQVVINKHEMAKYIAEDSQPLFSADMFITTHKSYKNCLNFKMLQDLTVEQIATYDVKNKNHYPLFAKVLIVKELIKILNIVSSDGLFKSTDLTSIPEIVKCENIYDGLSIPNFFNISKSVFNINDTNNLTSIKGIHCYINKILSPFCMFLKADDQRRVKQKDEDGTTVRSSVLSLIMDSRFEPYIKLLDISKILKPTKPVQNVIAKPYEGNEPFIIRLISLYEDNLKNIKKRPRHFFPNS